MAPFKLGVVQSAPVLLDRAATLAKTCTLIDEAAAAGARLVVFPEGYLSAYPDWVWLLPPGPQRALLDEMHAALFDSAVAIPDEATDRLCRAAREAKIHLAIGVHERNDSESGGSLYNTLLLIDDEGRILGRHRKLMPTGAERLVWAQGDGSTLAVYSTKLGRMGGLICWENYMPLARQALYEGGIQIHLAPTWDSSDAWIVAMQHIAKEGGMFVVSCCQAIHIDEIPERFAFKSFYPEGKTWINRGKSCIVDPAGKIIAGPLIEEQGILYADIDLSAIIAQKRLFDAAGHYSRRDVFEFRVKSPRTT